MGKGDQEVGARERAPREEDEREDRESAWVKWQGYIGMKSWGREWGDKS